MTDANTDTTSTAKASGTADVPRPDFLRVSSMESCIGVHIRHGDSINDKRGMNGLCSTHCTTCVISLPHTHVHTHIHTHLFPLLLF